MALFRRMTRHISEPGLGAPAVVHSDLAKGESAIGRRSLSLKYVASGAEIYHLGGRDYRLNAGQIMILGPGSAVSASVREGSAEGICIFLPRIASLDDDGLPFVDELMSPIVLSAAGRPLGRFLERVSERVGAHDLQTAAAHSFVCRASALLVKDIVRDRSAFRALPAVKLETRIDLIRRVEQARAFMVGLPDREITLDELACHVALSPHHLARTFKTVYGDAPIAYHRRLRLHLARRALIQGKSTPNQLALELGYCSHSAFTKAFKREFAKPPTGIGGSRRFP